MRPICSMGWLWLFRIGGLLHEAEHSVLMLWRGQGFMGFHHRSCSDRAVGTLVERKTRLLTLAKMEGDGAAAALEGFTRQMKRLPAFLRRSLTYDRGVEMACHPELARRLKIDSRFCDHQAPRPRGSNETTGGLLRQVLAKGPDLCQFLWLDFESIARLMNDRPRKTPGWKTPAQVRAEEIEKAASDVAGRTWVNRTLTFDRWLSGAA